MKTQMRFQKIFMLVSLIIAALCIVFALIFVSGSLFDLTGLYNPETKELSYFPEDNGGGVFDYEEWNVYAYGIIPIFEAVNNVSDTLLILGIVMVLCVVLNYIMATNKRRNYYVTNYVAIAIVTAFAIALAVVIIVMCANVQNLVATTNYDRYVLEDGTHCGIAAVYLDKYGKELVTDNLWSCYVGYALSAVLFVMAAGYILNLVWKLKLMQGEKKLLSGGLVKEVA